MKDKEKLSIISEDLWLLYGQLSDKQKDELLWMLTHEKIDKVQSISTKESIIRDLRDNHVKIEEDVEMMWCRWKRIYIELPAVWSFEWFKFSWFIPNESIKISDLWQHWELIEKSYSVKEVYELLHAITMYMRELWISIDDRIDFDGYSSYRDVFRFESWNILKSIAGTSDQYYLRDSDSSLIDSCAMWINYGGNSLFSKYWGDTAKLFMKVSD